MEIILKAGIQTSIVFLERVKMPLVIFKFMLCSFFDIQTVGGPSQNWNDVFSKTLLGYKLVHTSTSVGAITV